MDTETVKTLAEMLLEFLSTTGASLATQGFQIAVKYVVAQGILHTILGVLFLLCGVTLGIWDAKTELMEGFGVFFGVVLCIVSFVLLYSGILRLVSPEWFAIQNIINLF